MLEDDDRHDADVRIRRLALALAADPRATAHVRLPAREGVAVAWPAWLDPQVRVAYERRGIAQPWRHQVLTAELAHAGQHVIISSGTASGKSAAFGMPALTAALEGQPSQGGRGPGVLYLAPTKALAHDQLAGLHALGLPALRAGALDGDSSDDERTWARAHARWLVTNPDMLHRSVLPGHERWRAFLRALRYVVVDEAHVYRGVFGAHVSLVLRRLHRLCARYGGSPTYIAASATSADPGGRPVRCSPSPWPSSTRTTAREGPSSWSCGALRLPMRPIRPNCPMDPRGTRVASASLASPRTDRGALRAGTRTRKRRAMAGTPRPTSGGCSTRPPRSPTTWWLPGHPRSPSPAAAARSR